jgi:23S rRNA U2552 (ribose-2'-O)-methylase RlmE/FtsJ
MDLCAAPGGWLQVAQKYMPMSSLIVGVDLAPIKPIRGCTTFVDDITTQSCRAQLKRCTPEGTKYDIVITTERPTSAATSPPNPTPKPRSPSTHFDSRPSFYEKVDGS